MPPSRLLASPAEETVTSSLVPGVANTGSVAVTKTAATLFTRMVFPGICTPMRERILARVWVVKIVCWRSPVPRNPTTMPYPKTAFSRTPPTLAMSRSSAGWAVSSAATGAGHHAPLQIAKTRKTPTRKITSSETHNLQDCPYDRVRRTVAVADHAFALQLKLQVGDGVRSHRVVRPHVAGAHQPAQQ